MRHNTHDHLWFYPFSPERRRLPGVPLALSHSQDVQSEALCGEVEQFVQAGRPGQEAMIHIQTRHGV